MRNKIAIIPYRAPIRGRSILGTFVTMCGGGRHVAPACFARGLLALPLTIEKPSHRVIVIVSD